MNKFQVQILNGNKPDPEFKTVVTIHAVEAKDVRTIASSFYSEAACKYYFMEERSKVKVRILSEDGTVTTLA